jgi:hypothetical protein
MTTTPYLDPQTIHNPSTGASPPAAWGDTVRDDLETLARPPGCRMATTAAQTTTSGAWFNVSWNAGVDLRDTDGFHTGTGDTIVVPTGLGGIYHLSGSLVWEADAVGVRMARYSINGAGDYRLAAVASAGDTYATRLSFAEDIELDAADVLRIGAFQDTGGGRDLLADCKVSLRMVAVS